MFAVKHMECLEKCSLYIYIYITLSITDTHSVLSYPKSLPGLEYAIMSGGDVAPLEEQAVTELHKLFRCKP